MNTDNTTSVNDQVELTKLYKELNSDLTPVQRNSVQERIAVLEKRDIDSEI